MTGAAVWSIALAEARLARRLVRYWVFLGLSFVVALVMFLQYFFIHFVFSSSSATAAALNPRYLVGAVGNYFIMIFSFGAVFLACEVRAREERERVADALDARPYSNLELLTGKLLGLWLACWAPAVVVTLFFAALGWMIGAPLQPWSLVSLITFMAAPAFAITIAATFLVALLVRLRWLAVIVSALLLVGALVLSFRLPIYASGAADLGGGFLQDFPSDLTPGIADLTGWLQRLGLVLAAAGFVLLCTTIHPRRDDAPRGRRLALGFGVLLLGALAIGAVTSARRGALERTERWRAAHAARKADPAPDVVAISGRVEIVPGRTLNGDLQLRFRAPANRTLDRALFTLNPGYVVRSAADSAGRAVTFTFDQGLLELRLPQPLSGENEEVVRLQFEGRPDTDFAYVDAARNVLVLPALDAQIFLLGDEASIFDRRFVALPGGVRWLPASGADVGRDDARERPPDFFTLDLTVDVPASWTVAGPGRRRDATGAASNGKRFQFRPPAPLADATLVASRFESRAVEIQGVQCEILLHPSHASALSVFDDAVVEIRKWLEERFKEAADVGLAYPYDGLTMVEVPNTLRGYGGGWRMDTTFAAPGLLLTRESGLPTARFDRAFRRMETEAERREGGMPRLKRERLVRFFENDFSGGNPFLGAARSFLKTQTGATGPDAVALDFVVEDLAAQWLTGKRGFFSAHAFDRNINSVLGSAIGSVQSAGGGDFSDALIRAITNRPSVWDSALGTALARIDPWKDPRRALDVLTLKGGGLARALLDRLGKEKTGRLLAALRAAASGRAFTRADLEAAGRTVDEDLGPWLADALDSTALPGFVARSTRVTRLPDDADGKPRYQLLIVVQNDEPSPGLLQVRHRAASDDKDERQEQTAGPFRVPARGAIEIGVVSARPYDRVSIQPYVSLNRDAFTVQLPTVDPKKIEPGEAFVGARDVPWTPPPAGEILLDDLDSGFSAAEPGARGMLRVAARAPTLDLDGGLPSFVFGYRAPSRWSRMVTPVAYGKYRHTLALVKAGKGERTAAFRADLPKSGRYELAVFVPGEKNLPMPLNQAKGTWVYVIEAGGATKTAELNADAAAPGWNILGSFDLPSGTVEVKLTDKSEKSLVFADAIRWRDAGATSAR